MTFPSPGRRVAARRRPAWVVLSLAGLVLAAGCDDDGTEPGKLLYGRTSQMRIEVRTPLGRGVGELQQIVVWRSDGTWESTERLFYQGKIGDENIRRSGEAPETLAKRYATWIGLVNDSTPVRLFLGDHLNPLLVPTCATPQSTVTVRISDTERADSTSWTRCGAGSLAGLSAEEAGPDPAAGRVVEAAKLIRNATVAARGEFVSTYSGSLPFYTVD